MVTLVVTTWLGNRARLGAARSLLIGTGFAICGASAIAAMEDTAGADEEDVAVGIAMVTLFGTVAMVLLPLLAGPLGLTDQQFGIWAGASIQEVGQVVAAAGAGGAGVVAIAVVVKLTRVLLLAPVVATVSIRKRMAGGKTEGKRPPIVPLFVLGFLACVAFRSTGMIPTGALAAISQVQVAALGAALFGMGAAVQIKTLFRRSGPVLIVATLSTLLVAGCLAGRGLPAGRVTLGQQIRHLEADHAGDDAVAPPRKGADHPGRAARLRHIRRRRWRHRIERAVPASTARG